MYKVIKENKIIGISEDKPVLLDEYEVIEDTEHTCEDYEQYNGEYLLKSEIPAPTEEEQRQKREQAYTQEVDPITCHINRLRDIDPQTQEIIAEIEELQTERDGKVAEIKERFPYYDEN